MFFTRVKKYNKVAQQSHSFTGQAGKLVHEQTKD